MSTLKKLAGQTAVYGLTNIVGRLLNYLLVPYYTYLFDPKENAPIQIVYAWIPFLSIIYTYGMETAFFRFAQEPAKRIQVINTSSLSLLLSSIFFTLLMFIFYRPLASFMSISQHPEYVMYCALILMFDTLVVIPFAQLRLQNKPMKYGMFKILNILINIGLNVFFLSICPALIKNGYNWINAMCNPTIGVGYIFISNLIASGVTCIMLLPQWRQIQWKLDIVLWKEIMRYSTPLIIVGLAGMVNETLDRAFFLPHFLSYTNTNDINHAIGVYGNVYKLSILITLFIQAFRLGAEPFFFQHAAHADAKIMYARIMKYFVMLLSIMFLAVAMYLNVWKYFLRKPSYWEALPTVVPLLIANIFLGVYYNLTIWFKLTNQTKIGARITLITAALSFILNIVLIPLLGYYGSAIATMVCYGVQMVVCYQWGKKYYAIPYAVKKLSAIFILALLFYGVYWGFVKYIISPNDMYDLNKNALLLATGLLLLYTYILYRIERIYIKKLFSKNNA